MADKGNKILGIYTPSCEKLRQKCPAAGGPLVGNIVFFCEANKAKSNHAGLIYKVTDSTIYTVEGNTWGTSSLGTNGDVVATKSYSKTFARIMSYGKPNYTGKYTADDVIAVALAEVGYIGKKTNSKLNSKAANGGSGNFTKYGAWIGANGSLWSASFISWCFHVAFDSSSTEISGDDYSDDSTVKTVVNQSGYNSSLATYVNRLSSARSTPRTSQITKLTIHTSKKVGDMYDLSQMLNSSDKSYNYGIDSAGTIGLFADEILATNSSNSKLNDNAAVNIICMNSSLEPDYKISDECYTSLVNLCEDICRRNAIFSITYTGLSAGDTITLHSIFDPKSNCPGPYVKDKLFELTDTINHNLSTKVGVNFRQVNARLASSNAEALKVQSCVAVNSIKPYIILLDKKESNVNYPALREQGVIGVFINAKQRINANHKIVEYNTASIYKQAMEASYARMPHGFIFTTHAKSFDDIKEEAYWLYFVISKYPPKLGIWLHCAFDVKQSVAEKLVDEWYQYFIQWGLKSKCGLYATKLQADKIGWPKQSAYLPLWLEGQMTDSVCPDEELLTPSFFKLNDLTNQSAKAQGITDLNVLNETEEEAVDFTLPQGVTQFIPTGQATLADGLPANISITPIEPAQPTVDPDLTEEEDSEPQLTLITEIEGGSDSEADSGSEDTSTMSEAEQKEKEKHTLPTEDPKKGSSDGDDVKKAKKDTEDDSQVITIPKSNNYTGFKKWESYTSITRNDERSYAINNYDGTITDEDGFRKVDDRFLVCVGSGICTTIGTYLDIELENGTVIPCIMGDGKPDSHTDKANHIFSVTTRNYCCSEFIVLNRTGVLNPDVKSSGDCSNKCPEWKSPVKSIKVLSDNWFEEEDSYG